MTGTYSGVPVCYYYLPNTVFANPLFNLVPSLNLDDWFAIELVSKASTSGIPDGYLYWYIYNSIGSKVLEWKTDNFMTMDSVTGSIKWNKIRFGGNRFPDSGFNQAVSWKNRWYDNSYSVYCIIYMNKF